MEPTAPTTPPTSIHVTLVIKPHTEVRVHDLNPACDLAELEIGDIHICGPLGHLARLVDEAAHQLMLVDRARGVAEEALERVRGKANVELLRDTINRARIEAQATR